MLGGMPEEKNLKSNGERIHITEDSLAIERAKNVKVVLTPLKEYQLFKDCVVKLTPLRKELIDRYQENIGISAEDTTLLFPGVRRSNHLKNIRERT